MGNVFKNLPCPANNGEGAAVDVSAMGSPKSIVVSGGADCLVAIQVSNDVGHLHWQTIATFVAGAQGIQNVPAAAHWMRAVASDFSSGTPQVDVGSTDDGTTILALGLPPGGGGAGAALSTALLPLYKTFQIGGSFSGVLQVEVSEDGSSAWATIASFHNPGIQSFPILPTNFIRLKGDSGFSGSPTAYVAATNPPGGASGNPDVPTPPFQINTIVVYARTAGSDTTGDGKTIPTAYATLQRAVRDVPINIPDGTNYIVDITGITEVLPSDYTLPAWKSTRTINPNNNPDDKQYFFLSAGVAIRAFPIVFAGIPAGDCVIQAADVVSTAGVADPITGLLTFTLNVPRASWNASAIKGALVIPATPSGASSGPVVISSTTTTLVTTADVAPIFPLTIMQQSATLSGPATVLGRHGTLNAFNIDSIVFEGLNILSNGSVGLRIEGCGFAVVQSNKLQSPLISAVSPFEAKILSNWMTGAPLISCSSFSCSFGLMDGLTGAWLTNTIPASPSFHNMAFIGCTPIHVLRAFAFASSDPIPTSLSLSKCLVKSAVGDGIIINGGHVTLAQCDISSCAGNGVVANKGLGLVEINNCGSSSPNVGAALTYGLNVDDGMAVRVDVATSTTQPVAGRPLTGTSGDMKCGPAVGGLAVRTWADFVAGSVGHAVKLEYDIQSVSATGATGSGSKIYEPNGV